MEKEFVPYELAWELKQLGFDKPCLAFYERSKELIIQECEVTDFHTSSLQCLAPLYQQAFRWFREKHGIFIEPNRRIDLGDIWYYFFISSKRNDVCEGSFVYEEAELACLTKLIEIIEQTKN